MRAHIAYLRYVLRHKWYVFLECRRLGIPWLGIIHDWSKFRPGEWFPYVHSFYHPDGGSRKKGEATEWYDPTRVSDEFDRAWLSHWHRNAHHWQHWKLVRDEDEDKLLDMPDKYRREMLADWRGAGRALGKPDTPAWYRKWSHKIRLHTETRRWIEEQINVV